jgi:ribonuclease BN (tRNA processing enzyme)
VGRLAKLIFLGTCSGTEPMPGRHHSSFVLEVGDKYYWFDAGENCSHAAVTAGIDVSRIRAVFISHMHIDHVGGLANLLFVIRKLVSVTGKPHANGNSYDVFVPDLELFGMIRTVSTMRKEKETASPTIVDHEISDGLLFEDENIRVTALHNTHLGETGEDGWHSYSFLIETEGKRIVFSGDVKCPEELDPLTAGGCDALIMETGHHKVARVLAYANARGTKKLLFTHHGREILADPAAAARAAAAAHPDATVCRDGDTVIL